MNNVSVRYLSRMVNIPKTTLFRLFARLPADILQHNIELALSQPHYKPLYSLTQLGQLIGCSKRKALTIVKRCGIPIHYVGVKRIVLLSDLHQLNLQGDWIKHNCL